MPIWHDLIFQSQNQAINFLADFPDILMWFFLSGIPALIAPLHSRQRQEKSDGVGDTQGHTTSLMDSASSIFHGITLAPP